MVGEGDALFGQGVTFSGNPGQAITVTVGTFTDPTYPDNIASDFTAAIDWGDGTTTAGIVAGGSGSPFTVTGSHTYAAAGTDLVVVTLSDDPPGVASGVAQSIGAVSAPLAGHVVLTTATEGTALPGTTTVAIFTDTNTSDTAGDFTVSIDWGDGTTTSGMISGSDGSFTVSGGHTYADEGIDALSVTITDMVGNFAITRGDTVSIGEGDTLTAQPVTFAALVNTPFSGIVASFADTTYPGNVANDFTATINWGDGATTSGTVSGGSGSPFIVTGTHTYTALRTGTVAVTLIDDLPGTASGTADGTAQVTAQFAGQITEHSNRGRGATEQHDGGDPRRRQHRRYCRQFHREHLLGRRHHDKRHSQRRQRIVHCRRRPQLR